jgi:hypothetical protein
VRGAGEGGASLGEGHDVDLLGASEVGQLEGAVGRQQQIGRLQVSAAMMDDERGVVKREAVNHQPPAATTSHQQQR